jgi:hypothetical protein
LSPIKQSRELYPLDATLDSKSQKQAIEMRFHRSLGDVQVASDFRVVTSLQQQVDNLPLPWSHLAEMFFHKNCTSPTRSEAASGAETCPLGASGFGSLRHILHSRGQNDVWLLTKCEISA